MEKWVNAEVLETGLNRQTRGRQTGTNGRKGGIRRNRRGRIKGPGWRDTRWKINRVLSKGSSRVTTRRRHKKERI